MPGFYPHLIAGLMFALIVHIIHFKLEFSVAVFIGNLLPDALKFIISAISQGTIYIFHIEHNNFYSKVSAYTGSLSYWLSFGFMMLGVLLFLYHYHFIKKRKMERYAEFWGFLLLGVIIHIIMDVFVKEQGIWF